MLFLSCWSFAVVSVLDSYEWVERRCAESSVQDSVNCFPLVLLFLMSLFFSVKRRI